MKITDIIVTLLFIIPGAISLKIISWLSMPGKERNSEFHDLVASILWSFPIIFISGYGYWVKYKFQSLSYLSVLLDEISYLIEFVLVILITSIVLGIIMSLTKDLWLKGINVIRRKVLKKAAINLRNTCWEDLFNTLESQYIEIVKDGKSLAEGFVKYYSLPNEEKEVIIYDPCELKDYPEYKDRITQVKQVYFNLDKNIVIYDYDLEDYYKFCDEIEKKYAQE